MKYVRDIALIIAFSAVVVHVAVLAYITHRKAKNRPFLVRQETSNGHEHVYDTVHGHVYMCDGVKLFCSCGKDAMFINPKQYTGGRYGSVHE